MDWQAFAAIALGYVGQWLKAFKKFPTWGVQLTLGLAAVGLYALDTPFRADPAWFKAALMWAFSVLGVASVAAAAKAAPPTDSIH